MGPTVVGASAPPLVPGVTHHALDDAQCSLVQDLAFIHGRAPDDQVQGAVVDRRALHLDQPGLQLIGRPELHHPILADPDRSGPVCYRPGTSGHPEAVDLDVVHPQVGVVVIGTTGYELPPCERVVLRIEASTTPWAVGYLFYGTIALGLLVAAGRTPEPAPVTA